MRNASTPIGILARHSLLKGEELLAMQQYFPVYTLRTQIPEGMEIIGRMSVLPYYKEVYDDVRMMGSCLVNTPYEHDAITGLDWVNAIPEHTFKTWHRAQDIPNRYRDKAFIVKGAVNSKKFQWNTAMFAKDFHAAVNVAASLRNDAFVGMQPIIFREYIPLKQYAHDEISGLPFVNEWRIFCYEDKIVFEQFYWEQFLIDERPDAVEDANIHFAATGRQFAEHILSLLRAQEDTNIAKFFAMDIAQTQEGQWIVVELNDGQMSGLNGANPLAFYEALSVVTSSSN